MKSLVLLLALFGLLGCAITVSGLECYFCAWADTDDKEILEQLGLLQSQISDDCKNDPPSEYLDTVDETHFKRTTNNSDGSRPALFPIKGLKNQPTITPHASNQDVYCLKGTAKFLGVKVVLRGGSAFDEGFLPGMGGKCDKGEKLGYDSVKDLSDPKICYCTGNKCNSAGLTQISSFSLALSVITVAAISKKLTD